MSQAQLQNVTKASRVVQFAIIALVLVTAAVHLQRGIGMSLGGFGGGRGFPPPGAGAGRLPGGPPPGGFNMFRYLPLPLSTLFLINGIGYLLLGAAYSLPSLARFRPQVRWLLIAFAAATFVLYFLFNGFRLNPVAVLDKVAELALIALLLIDGRRARQPAQVEVATA